MHPTQQDLEFIRELLKLGSPSRASFRHKKNLPLICLFSKPLTYCFLGVYLIRKFSCFIPSNSSVKYYNPVLALFSASSSPVVLCLPDPGPDAQRAQ
jgi:hypothetical protein